VFNRDSCVACHSDPAAGGGSVIVETRFGTITNGAFNPLTALGGPLLQERGIRPVGTCNIVGEVVPPQATIVIQRRTTPTFGSGLVESVPDETLMEIAAFQTRVTPETAGRPCPNVNLVSGQKVVGRFGWKCQDPNMLQFAGDAMNNEAGITNPLFPKENCPQGDCSLLACDPVAEPNDDGTFMAALADFMRLLAPPPRGAITPEVRVGEAVFGRIGCAACHLPTLRTGPNPIAALDRVDFHPYSDFLLHDMGSLNDGFPQGEASGQEMRTAPLWGRRMIAT